MHCLVGVTTLGDIARVPVLQLPLVNPAKVTSRGYRASGMLTIERGGVVHETSLLEYVRGGCEISLMVAV